MTNVGADQSAGREPGWSEDAVSRRAILQLAGGAASIAAASSIVTGSAAQAADTGHPSTAVSLTVNGTQHKMDVDVRQSLLDVLRETLDLTGTKKGCNQGACGACTILVNGRRVVACLTLAAMHDGAEIQTIEGLAQGEELHPLQAAFIEHEGMQCGFCTPGQIMSGVACIAEGHTASADEIKFWMSGNICRCGAYPGTVAAVAEAAERS
jgi:xanthine dehydrogenase YagT iron-sulfur-binding subunit